MKVGVAGHSTHNPCSWKVGRGLTCMAGGKNVSMNESFEARVPVVVKVGSASLVDEKGGLSKKVIRHLADDIDLLMRSGSPVCLVSSGAIAAGMAAREMTSRPKTMESKQALAAIGQVRLMQLYSEAFARRSLQVAQILLTHEGLASREGFVNARKTLTQLFRIGVVPIINENDTVSTREIEFGDNDQLAVLVANLVEASMVFFLSATPGLLDLERGGELIREVHSIDSEILAKARGGNRHGKGGMGSKLLAIDALNRAGKSAWLIDGRKKGQIGRVVKARELERGVGLGTLFHANGKPQSSRRQWMLQHLRPHGSIEVDAGAFRAIASSKASLLSPGVSGVSGTFRAGQLVRLLHEGREFARGMTRLGSRDLEKVMGQSSKQCAELLGPHAPRHIIHRNDIALHEAMEKKVEPGQVRITPNRK